MRMRMPRPLDPIATLASLALVGLVGLSLYGSAATPTPDPEPSSIVFVCKNGVAMSVWSALNA